MDGSKNTRIAIYAAGGRMGQALLAASTGLPGIEIVAALVRAQSDLVDTPVAGMGTLDGVELTYDAALDPDVGVDVLIDFSAGAAFDNALAIAVEHRSPKRACRCRTSSRLASK